MPGFPVPKLRVGGKARPKGGKDGYAGRVGGGRGHGNAESESWQIKEEKAVSNIKELLHLNAAKPANVRARFLTLSDPDSEETDEAEECC